MTELSDLVSMAFKLHIPMDAQVKFLPATKTLVFWTDLLFVKVRFKGIYFAIDRTEAAADGSWKRQMTELCQPIAPASIVDRLYEAFKGEPCVHE